MSNALFLNTVPKKPTVYIIAAIQTSMLVCISNARYDFKIISTTTVALSPLLFSLHVILTAPCNSCILIRNVSISASLSLKNRILLKLAARNTGHLHCVLSGVNKQGV